MNTRSLTTAELLFDLSYGLYLIFALLSSTLYFKYYVGKPYHLIMLTSALLLVIREWIKDEMQLRTIGFALLTILLMLLTIKNNHVFSIAMLFLFVFSARDTEPKRIAYLSLIITVAVFLFVLVSAKLGIIDNYLEFTSGRVRQYLGFSYSLFAPTVAFNILALLIWIRKEKMRWITLLVLAGFQYWICKVTDSRLTLMCALLCIAGVALLKLVPDILEKIKPFAFLVVTSYIWCAVLSLIVTVQYTTKQHWMVQLNKLLGRRLYLGNESWKKYGVKWLGQQISWQGNGLDIYGKNPKVKYDYVDNLYQQFLQRSGILFFLLILVLFTVLMYRLYRRKEYYLMLILFVLAVHAMIDDLIYYLYFNTFWLCLGIYLFREEQQRDAERILEPYGACD